MSAPFQPGDVVVCVDASAPSQYWRKRSHRFPLALGSIWRVRGTGLSETGEEGIYLFGYRGPIYDRTKREAPLRPDRFRKIDDEVTDEFRQALKSLKSPTPETADA